jgi:excisionase family DNA binding protein
VPDPPQAFVLGVALAPEQLRLLAAEVARLLEERRDDGFLDVIGAAAYLSTTRKAIYHLVERGRLPHHRPAGRLLFDRAKLRAWVEADQ